MEEYQPDEAIRDYLRRFLNSTATRNSKDFEIRETLAHYIDNEAAVQSILQEVSEAKRKPKKGRSKNKTATKLIIDDEEENTEDTQNAIQRSSRQPKQDTAEDEASAWTACQAEEIVWGGRGRGGRGAYSGRVNSVRSNIHLEDFSISNGTELLCSAMMDITKGHRYGLVGRNGCGKSTLLHRLANKAIPGMPYDMKVLLVEQRHNMLMDLDSSTLDVLIDSDEDRQWLLREQERIENLVESGKVDDMNEAVQLLSDIAEDLDILGADTIEARAMEILRGLQFRDDMINGKVGQLSGGWRMRLAIARALLVQSDLICLDEVTNHLDLNGLEWLIRFINASDKTIIVVSHDPVFLDAICTDIIVMAHNRLDHHVGSYSQYQKQQQEKAARDAQILDASERQKAKAQAFVQKQQAMANKKSADPNKQRQAKMIREKKLDRIGNYREDGKRYKLRSLKKLDEKHVLLAQKVQIEMDEKAARLRFPDPMWPSSVSPTDSIVRIEDLSYDYEGNSNSIIKGITAHIDRGAKIALVGANGSGKSTLMKLIDGQLQNGTQTGSTWIHPNIRIGHITQYSVEELEQFKAETVMEYANKRLLSGSTSARIVAEASGNVRQYLGAFGLGGKHALQQIGQLSGGERMRLCFATCLAEEPHLLLLDESTNHVDLETLESMSEALNRYQGSVLMVSHNQAFLRGFCKELWVLEGGKLDIRHSETATFDEMFSHYRQDILGVSGSKSLSGRRKEKTVLAKKATAQRAGTKEATALL